MTRRLSGAARALLRTRPRQPDAFSCGAACLVLERALRDDDYARAVADPDRFGAEVEAMHRRATGPVAPSGRLQVPWTRLLGTAPWSVVGQLSGRGQAWRARWLRGSPAQVTAQVLDAVAAGHRVVLFVGTRLLPRHVVLVVDADGERLAVYDPATGGLRPVPVAALRCGRTGFARWHTAWWAVLPTPPPARRTPA